MVPEIVRGSPSRRLRWRNGLFRIGDLEEVTVRGACMPIAVNVARQLAVVSPQQRAKSGALLPSRRYWLVHNLTRETQGCHCKYDASCRTQIPG